MGERDLGGRGAARRRSNAGHDLVIDAGLGERQSLFAAAAKDKRIASLEAHDPFSFKGMGYQHASDHLLSHGVQAGSFAAVDAQGILRRFGEKPVIYQTVIQDDIGPLNAFQRFDRNQIRIARARSDDADAPPGASVALVHEPFLLDEMSAIVSDHAVAYPAIVM
ncbi:hypothetical protein D1872_241040 [compost metagenome]